MLIDEECKTITTEKGFRMVRANCGVREGQWYYEVTIDRGGEPRYEGRDGAHVRLGWARREGNQTAHFCNIEACLVKEEADTDTFSFV